MDNELSGMQLNKIEPSKIFVSLRSCKSSLNLLLNEDYKRTSLFHKFTLEDSIHNITGLILSANTASLNPQRFSYNINCDCIVI